MKKLIFDTAVNESYIMLIDADKLIEIKQLSNNFLHSNKFIFEIESLLKKHCTSLNDLSCIALGTGPGSYTGLRVGASIANALSFAKKIPLISFCSLEAYIPKKNGTFAAIFDAKAGGFYVLFGKRENHDDENNGNITYLEKAQKISLDKFSNLLNEIDYIISPHIEIIKKRLFSLTNINKKNFEEKFEENENSFNANHLIKLVNEKFSNHKFSKIPVNLQYL